MADVNNIASDPKTALILAVDEAITLIQPPLADDQKVPVRDLYKHRRKVDIYNATESAEFKRDVDEFVPGNPDAPTQNRVEDHLRNIKGVFIDILSNVRIEFYEQNFFKRIEKAIGDDWSKNPDDQLVQEIKNNILQKNGADDPIAADVTDYCVTELNQLRASVMADIGKKISDYTAHHGAFHPEGIEELMQLTDSDDRVELAIRYDEVVRQIPLLGSDERALQVAALTEAVKQFSVLLKRPPTDDNVSEAVKKFSVPGDDMATAALQLELEGLYKTAKQGRRDKFVSELAQLITQTIASAGNLRAAWETKISTKDADINISTTLIDAYKEIKTKNVAAAPAFGAFIAELTLPQRIDAKDLTTQEKLDGAFRRSIAANADLQADQVNIERIYTEQLRKRADAAIARIKTKPNATEIVKDIRALPADVRLHAQTDIVAQLPQALQTQYCGFILSDLLASPMLNDQSLDAAIDHVFQTEFRALPATLRDPIVNAYRTARTTRLTAWKNVYRVFVGMRGVKNTLQNQLPRSDNIDLREEFITWVKTDPATIRAFATTDDLNTFIESIFPEPPPPTPAEYKIVPNGANIKIQLEINGVPVPGGDIVPPWFIQKMEAGKQREAMNQAGSLYNILDAQFQLSRNPKHTDTAILKPPPKEIPAEIFAEYPMTTEAVIAKFPAFFPTPFKEQFSAKPSTISKDALDRWRAQHLPALTKAMTEALWKAIEDKVKDKKTRETTLTNINKKALKNHLSDLQYELEEFQATMASPDTPPSPANPEQTAEAPVSYLALEARKERLVYGGYCDWDITKFDKETRDVTIERGPIRSRDSATIPLEELEAENVEIKKGTVLIGAVNTEELLAERTSDDWRVAEDPKIEGDNKTVILEQILPDGSAGVRSEKFFINTLRIPNRPFALWTEVRITPLGGLTYKVAGFENGSYILVKREVPEADALAPRTLKKRVPIGPLNADNPENRWVPEPDYIHPTAPADAARPAAENADQKEHRLLIERLRQTAAALMPEAKKYIKEKHHIDDEERLITLASEGIYIKLDRKINDTPEHPVPERRGKTKVDFFDIFPKATV